MLPGCMSAWKKLWRNTWVKKICTPFSASRWIFAPRRLQLGDVADQHAVDALHHHHVAAAVVPVHLGHVQQVGALEIAPQLRGVRRLAHQVELVEDGLLVFVARPRSAAAAGPRGVIAREPREHVHHLEVALDVRAHAGPQHLDDDLLPALERRRVHLGDRGRRERRLVEALEDLGDRPAVGALDDRARLGARERRHAVLQLRELVGDVLGQQVAPGRERLAELDEDRPQPLQREADALAARAAARALEPGRRRQVEHEAQRPEQVGREDDVVEPVPHEHALDGEQAAEDAQTHVSGSDAAGTADRQPAASARPRCRARRASSRSTSSRSRSTSLQELLDFEASRHVAAFLLQVLRRARRERVACAAAEVEQLACEVRDAACRDVAARSATALPRRRDANARGAPGTPARSPRRLRCARCRCAVAPRPPAPRARAATGACPRAVRPREPRAARRARSDRRGLP